MKAFINRLMHLVALLGFSLPSCSDVDFRGNPYVYEYSSASYDTSSMLDAEFYKVVLVLDPSNSMTDDLDKLSNALDDVIQSAQGYNIRFYIYNTDSNFSVDRSTVVVRPYFYLKESKIVYFNDVATFSLKDGSYATRDISTSSSSNDWNSYDYSIGITPPIAIFELTKNSLPSELELVKSKLRDIVVRTNAFNVASDEYGICSIKRILSETGPNRILYPGDKVNFILISDENNKGGLPHDQECTSGGTLTKIDTKINTEWCIKDFVGTNSDKNSLKLHDCTYNDYDQSLLVNQAESFEINSSLESIYSTLAITYKKLDDLHTMNFNQVVNYNYEPTKRSSTACEPTDLAKVQTHFQQEKIPLSNLISCENVRYNITISPTVFKFTKVNSESNSNLAAQNQTFSGKHCSQNSAFFDSNTGITYPSYRHALAARLSTTSLPVDPLKIKFSSCKELLSIQHLGNDVSNPLGFADDSLHKHTFRHFDSNIKTLADNILGSENYVVASFHYSSDLDNEGENACMMDPLQASYGDSQNQMISDLGPNGYRQSLCAPDFSGPLMNFAHSFIKDQNRTFTIRDFRTNTEVESIKINGNEFIHTPNAFRLVGNKVILKEGSISPGDIVTIHYKYPSGLQY